MSNIENNPAIRIANSLWGLATGWVVGIAYGFFVKPEVEKCQASPTNPFGSDLQSSLGSSFPCTIIGGWSSEGVIWFCIFASVFAFLAGLIWITIENRDRVPRKQTGATPGQPTQPPPPSAL